MMLAIKNKVWTDVQKPGIGIIKEYGNDERMEQKAPYGGAYNGL